MPKPKQEPTWQPLSQLPMIASMIDGMTDSAEEQLVNLQQAEEQPHDLDNATLDRLTRVYTEQQGDLWLYEEQLARWRQQSWAAGQQAEIVRLDQRLARLRTLIADLLARAQWKVSVVLGPATTWTSGGFVRRWCARCWTRLGLSH